MILPKMSRWCVNLRLKCFLIGYTNLIASVVDICFHVCTVAILTRSFQCDVSQESIKYLDWPWLEPILLIINLGTHGFYPFPLILANRNNAFVEYMTVTSHPKCYPGVLHVQLVDVLNFLINLIWLKFVRSYVVALHKKDLEPMRLFFGLSFVKLLLQVLYFSYQPVFGPNSTVEAYWFMKLLDIVISSIFLMIIYKYIKQLRMEKAQVTEQPPPYIECLINGTPVQMKDDKKEIRDVEVVISDDKKAAENVNERV